MPTYRLLLEYDGTDFHGWQVQPNVRTVQGEIDRALSILTRESVRSAGAGRTDRGVHARGQVVSFQLENAIDGRRVVAGIHGLCGGDLRVQRLEQAPDRFHARHDALWRAYSYRLLDHASPLWRRRAWHPPSLPPLPLLREMSEVVRQGEDFTSLANLSPENGTCRCRILSVEWTAWEEGLLFSIRADRFLYRMVRNLVATLVREASAGRSPEAMRDLLAARDRRAAASPAPAEGLCFEAVGYDPPWP
jgi:tRNA pseudouridine38-40 synthase